MSVHVKFKPEYFKSAYRHRVKRDVWYEAVGRVHNGHNGYCWQIRVDGVLHAFHENWTWVRAPSSRGIFSLPSASPSSTISVPKTDL